MNKEARDEYMARIDAEFRRYEADMCQKPGYDLFEQAASILNMRYAYDFLRSHEVSDRELEYVMQTRYPLREIAETYEAFRSAGHVDNPIAMTVFDICEKNLLDGADTEKYDGHIPICFCRKPSNLWDVIDTSRGRTDDPYKIVKVIQLSKDDFDYFAAHLLMDSPFIKANTGLMRVDVHDQFRFHCLLVHDKSRARGILVESDGTPYARHAAYVENTRHLELAKIPFEEYKHIAPARARKPKQQER